MLRERINTKPLITIHFFKIFDKTNNFALLICYGVPVPTKLHIAKQKLDPRYSKFSAELNKITPNF